MAAAPVASPTNSTSMMSDEQQPTPTGISGQTRGAEREEFGSAAWLERLAKIFSDLAAARPDRIFPVVCEVYRDAPPHLLRQGATTISWTRRAHDGQAWLSLEECSEAEADVKIIGDYTACRALAGFLVTPETVEDYRALIDEKVRRELVRMICDKRDPTLPPDYTAHNLIAQMTR